MIERDEQEIIEIIKPRDRVGHKGNFGHTFIVAGSFEFVGAPYFSTEGAVRSGSGLVTLFTREKILEIMKMKLNEAMVRDIKELSDQLNKADSIVFGSGMGESWDTYESLLLLKDSKIPLVIDADGLNVLKKFDGDKFLKNRSGTTIITPHLAEFARLTGIGIESIKKDRLKIASEFAKTHGIIVLLKDSETVITDGTEIYVNKTGNSSMSNGGMGDILAGMVGSFLAQGYKGLESSKLASYLLGKCGELISQESYISNPRDIVQILPNVMKKTVQKKCLICYNIE
ncbi:MAG: NAD(P)H-hydrate dehydratase [Fusobacteriaceae bacterium]